MGRAARVNYSVEVIDHARLTVADQHELRRLFDSEYFQDLGPWVPELPYGYAPHDVHIIARMHGRVIGHVGWARRVIEVGLSDVVIAGTGGVLVAPEARGMSIGSEIMRCAVQSMTTRGGIEFGYLGCREEVVPFYTSCGWTRITARETWIDRNGGSVVEEPGSPIMVRPLSASAREWPDGDINLRGRAW